MRQKLFLHVQWITRVSKKHCSVIFTFCLKSLTTNEAETSTGKLYFIIVNMSWPKTWSTNDTKPLYKFISNNSKTCIRLNPVLFQQIMFNLDKVYHILDEMVMNGCIVETSKTKILEPVKLMESQRWRTVINERFISRSKACSLGARPCYSLTLT